MTRSAFGGTGLRMINSDNAFEVALKKNNLSLKMPEDEAEARDIVRARAKQQLVILWTYLLKVD